MATVEQKEFKSRDIILLVVFIAIAISVIALTTMYAPGQIFQNILMIVFLGSYTMLLFTFSYVFSKLTKMRAQLISAGFGVASLIAALASLLGPLSDSYSIYRAIAFFVLSGFCFGATIFEQRKTVENKSRWYVAAQPPALFVLLFVFFNFLYGGTLQVWFPILMDVFGFTFAILIILYLSSMFSWKTVGLFAVLLTILDIILVIGTGTMVVAAKQFTGLGLPVLVYLPNVPFVYSTYRCSVKSRFGFRRFLLCRRPCSSNLQQIRQKNRLYRSCCNGSGFWHLGSLLTRHHNRAYPDCWKKHSRVPRNFDDYKRLGTYCSLEITYFKKQNSEVTHWCGAN